MAGFLSGGVIDAMKMQMAYNNKRQVVLSKNIANSDTPRYQAKDLSPPDFGKMLHAHQGVKLAVTQAGHMAGRSAGDDGAFKTITPQTSETTPTGNNVVLEEQVTKLAQNNTDYQAVTNLYRKMIGMIKTANGSR